MIYVTGVPGAGKTSVNRELRRRGFRSFDTDDDGIAAFFSADGSMVPSNEVEASAEWRSKHTWRIVAERLHASRSGCEARVFVCGSAANEADFWDDFDAVIALVTDDDTLRQRLTTRTADDYGSSPDELAQVLRWNRGYANQLARAGAVVIDSTRPIDAVVDHILLATTALHPGS